LRCALAKAPRRKRDNAGVDGCAAKANDGKACPEYGDGVKEDEGDKAAANKKLAQADLLFAAHPLRSESREQATGGNADVEQRDHGRRGCRIDAARHDQVGCAPKAGRAFKRAIEPKRAYGSGRARERKKLTIGKGLLLVGGSFAGIWQLAVACGGCVLVHTALPQRQGKEQDKGDKGLDRAYGEIAAVPA